MNVSFDVARPDGGTRPYGFTLNVLGQIVDGRGGGPETMGQKRGAWDIPEYAVRRKDNYWTWEMRIPWEMFNIDKMLPGATPRTSVQDLGGGREQSAFTPAERRAESGERERRTRQ